MAKKEDYYYTLGIERNATEDDIKKAYRKLAMKHHPDRNLGDGAKAAEEKFKEVKAAYEFLSDREKRAAYDQRGHQDDVKHDFQGAASRDFDVFFAEMRADRERSEIAAAMRKESIKGNIRALQEEARPLYEALSTHNAVYEQFFLNIMFPTKVLESMERSFQRHTKERVRALKDVGEQYKIYQKDRDAKTKVFDQRITELKTEIELVNSLSGDQQEGIVSVKKAIDVLRNSRYGGSAINQFMDDLNAGRVPDFKEVIAALNKEKPKMFSAVWQDLRDGQGVSRHKKEGIDTLIRCVETIKDKYDLVQSACQTLGVSGATVVEKIDRSEHLIASKDNNQSELEGKEEQRAAALRFRACDLSTRLACHSFIGDSGKFIFSPAQLKVITWLEKQGPFGFRSSDHEGMTEINIKEAVSDKAISAAEAAAEAMGRNIESWSALKAQIYGPFSERGGQGGHEKRHQDIQSVLPRLESLLSIVVDEMNGFDISASVHYNRSCFSLDTAQDILRGGDLLDAVTAKALLNQIKALVPETKTAYDASCPYERERALG